MEPFMLMFIICQELYPLEVFRAWWKKTLKYQFKNGHRRTSFLRILFMANWTKTLKALFTSWSTYSNFCVFMFKTWTSLFPPLTHQYFYSTSPWNGLHHPLKCPTGMLTSTSKLGLFAHLLALPGYVIWAVVWHLRLPIGHVYRNRICGGWFTSKCEGIILCFCSQSQVQKPWLMLPHLRTLSWGWTNLFCYFPYTLDKIGYRGTQESLSHPPHWLM